MRDIINILKYTNTNKNNIQYLQTKNFFKYKISRYNFTEDSRRYFQKICDKRKWSILTHKIMREALSSTSVN